MLKGFTTEEHLYAWRNRFQALNEQYAEHLAGSLPFFDLTRLIDGIETILFPLLVKRFCLHSETITAWDPRLNTDMNRQLWYNQAGHRVGRKNLCSMARNALTAWLLDDRSFQSWRDNDRAPVYAAVAALVRDMYVTDVASLVLMLEAAVPEWIPETRKAEWERYFGV